MAVREPTEGEGCQERGTCLLRDKTTHIDAKKQINNKKPQGNECEWKRECMWDVSLLALYNRPDHSPTPPLTRDPPPAAAAGSWVFEYVCVRVEMLLQSTKAVRICAIITHSGKHLLAHFLSHASRFYRPFVSCR